MQTCATDKYKAKSPVYSLSMRYNIPGDRTAKPGPGAYASEKVTFILRKLKEHFVQFQIDTKTSPPEYSFGVRHSKYVFEAKPSPGIPTRPLPY